MSKNREDINEKINTCQENVFEASIKLDRAVMALRELLNCYNWDYEPSARDAVEYGNALSEYRYVLSEKAKWSWEYINDYKKIMRLVNVAYDYCCSALEHVNASQEV